MSVEQSDFAYKNIVLGASEVKARGAAGAAARIIRSQNGARVMRPEFENMGLQRVTDVWDLLGV